MLTTSNASEHSPSNRMPTIIAFDYLLVSLVPNTVPHSTAALKSTEHRLERFRKCLSHKDEDLSLVPVPTEKVEHTHIYNFSTGKADRRIPGTCWMAILRQAKELSFS